MDERNGAPIVRKAVVQALALRLPDQWSTTQLRAAAPLFRASRRAGVSPTAAAAENGVGVRAHMEHAIRATVAGQGNDELTRADDDASIARPYAITVLAHDEIEQLTVRSGCRAWMGTTVKPRADEPTITKATSTCTR